MYNTQAALSWWTWILHVSIVIIGGYFLANLALAVIFLQFTRYHPALAEDPEEVVSEGEDGLGISIKICSPCHHCRCSNIHFDFILLSTLIN